MSYVQPDAWCYQNDVEETRAWTDYSKINNKQSLIQYVLGRHEKQQMFNK